MQRRRGTRQPKPAWDDTVHDLSEHKLSSAALRRRKEAHASRHANQAKQLLQAQRRRNLAQPQTPPQPHTPTTGVFRLLKAFRMHGARGVLTHIPSLLSSPRDACDRCLFPRAALPRRRFVLPPNHAGQAPLRRTLRPGLEAFEDDDNDVHGHDDDDDDLDYGAEDNYVYTADLLQSPHNRRPRGGQPVLAARAYRTVVPGTANSSFEETHAAHNDTAAQRQYGYHAPGGASASPSERAVDWEHYAQVVSDARERRAEQESQLLSSLERVQAWAEKSADQIQEPNSPSRLTSATLQQQQAELAAQTQAQDAAKALVAQLVSERVDQLETRLRQALQPGTESPRSTQAPASDPLGATTTLAAGTGPSNGTPSHNRTDVPGTQLHGPMLAILEFMDRLVDGTAQLSTTQAQLGAQQERTAERLNSLEHAQQATDARLEQQHEVLTTLEASLRAHGDAREQAEQAAQDQFGSVNRQLEYVNYSSNLARPSPSWVKRPIGLPVLTRIGPRVPRQILELLNSTLALTNGSHRASHAVPMASAAPTPAVSAPVPMAPGLAAGGGEAGPPRIAPGPGAVRAASLSGGQPLPTMQSLSEPQYLPPEFQLQPEPLYVPLHHAAPTNQGNQAWWLATTAAPAGMPVAAAPYKVQSAPLARAEVPTAPSGEYTSPLPAALRSASALTGLSASQLVGSQRQVSSASHTASPQLRRATASVTTAATTGTGPGVGDDPHQDRLEAILARLRASGRELAASTHFGANFG
ncbi:uncharacterized protein MONBRDRAFT_27630 [Monosiga brevicollis MX1]|uniref:Spindle and centriole-associated protein 1 n=1 Tax=Monosiga brevicollis TaxID=81824 RepID=A9V5U9_MONBE|nr:uncharacterized protein MONBRDRAFT_27630 [Monosiga brevicollis MX1]EDQ87107.1 predicted protein [Monosiga brevicollis MX1]|eukprot:XP_001748050.1 hypothetical protein [Monosiga brevicollis MX1]